jgi:hypothetical protein
MNHHIIDTAELRRISGLTRPATLARWASNQRIPVKAGAHGPWTTLEALNKAFAVSTASKDHAYSPDIV